MTSTKTSTSTFTSPSISIVNTTALASDSNSTESFGTCDLPPWWVYVSTAGGFFSVGLGLTCVYYALCWLLQLAGVQWPSSGPDEWDGNGDGLKYSAGLSQANYRGALDLPTLERPSCSRAFLRLVKRFEALLVYAERLESGSSFEGKLYNVVLFMASIASWILYIVSATILYATNISEYGLLRICGRTWTVWFDFSFNVVFLGGFFLRFLASRQKILFFITPTSITDYLTIPQILLAVVAGVDWTGLRFARSIRLLNIPDILVYLNLLHGFVAIRLVKIICTLATVIFTSGGIISLLEALGDFWIPTATRVSQNISYLDSIYFLIVTITSTGYGDIAPKTVLGKLFICIFLIGAVAYFTTVIPEIVRLLAGHPIQFPSSFEKHLCERHVILCGELSYRNIRYVNHNIRILASALS